MPSSPKFFHARQPPSGRRSTVLIICFCLVFGLVALRSNQYKCLTSQSRSVRVVWERIIRSSSENGLVLGDGDENSSSRRHKVMSFVGIQTGSNPLLVDSLSGRLGCRRMHRAFNGIDFLHAHFH
ncbi:hypothetical protein M0R45_014643 [Rubus argutus]|uniref:Uncharacterized protein n=1 Tax=Rubus argutus TaxID=59490 RepID=A0AAW1XLX2_RUBAR